MRTSERAGPGSVVFGPSHRSRAAALLLSTAFALSAGHVGYLTAFGWWAPDEHIWVTQLSGFAAAALVLVDRTWVWWVTTALVAGFIAVGISMYSVLFVPSLQTAIGWFVTDIHLGLLVLTLGLCVHRLRGP